MKLALLSKNKIKFINGEIQEPVKTNPLHDAWERCNMMVIDILDYPISQYTDFT